MDLSVSNYFVHRSVKSDEDYISYVCRRYIRNRPEMTNKAIVDGELGKVKRLSTDKAGKATSSLNIAPVNAIPDFSMDDSSLNIISELLMNPKIKNSLRRALLIFLYSKGFLASNFDRISIPYEIVASKTDPTPLRDYIEMDIIDRRKELAELMTQLDTEYPGLSEELSGINLLINKEIETLNNAIKRYTSDIDTYNDIKVKVNKIRNEYFDKNLKSPIDTFIKKYNLGSVSTVYGNHKDAVHKILRNCIKDDIYYSLESDYYRTTISNYGSLN